MISFSPKPKTFKVMFSNFSILGMSFISTQNPRFVAVDKSVLKCFPKLFVLHALIFPKPQCNIMHQIPPR